MLNTILNMIHSTQYIKHKMDFVVCYLCCVCYLLMFGPLIARAAMQFALCLQRRSLSFLKVLSTSAVSVYKKQWRCFGSLELARRGVLIATALIANSSGVSDVCRSI